MKVFLNACLGLTLLLALSGCMTYRDFPTEMVGKPPSAKPYAKLAFKIERFDALTLGGGDEALRDALKRQTPFMDAEAVDEMPATGIFCKIAVDQKPVGLPVLAAGYVSYATLGFIPAWSTKDGMRLNYELYVDGVRKERREYEVTRKSAVWLGLLPFIWVNAMTYSEADAVKATAYKFFEEVNPVIAASARGT